MKRFTVALAALLFCINAFSQTDTIQPPYKKFPTYPPVKLLLPDSSGYYAKESLPKKMPVMLMLFNPSCDHCKQETEDLVKNIEKFKDIQIVMATNVPLKEIRTFIEEYKLAQYKNIVVTQDTHYFLISFYQLHNFPFLAFYNKKKELISVFQGSMPMEKVLKQFGK